MRLLGVFILVVVVYAVLIGCFPQARSLDNHLDLARRLGFYGILTLGVGTLIVAGGIDLSIGSLVGLGAISFGLLLQQRWHPLAAAGLVVSGGLVFGTAHGLLVTRLKLPPFLVTLCGLFIYRGLARWLAGSNIGLGSLQPEAIRERAEQFQQLTVFDQPLGLPNIFVLLIVIAAVLAVFLHMSVNGRYLTAIGANEQAARYAGIAVERHQILAYAICASFAGLGGVLYLFFYGSATPSSAGSLLELSAITGAVVGGCSLRGGEGTVAGMLLGAAILPMLSKICNFSPWIGSDLEYVVIGSALLAGTIVNEVIARRK